MNEYELLVSHMKEKKKEFVILQIDYLNLIQNYQDRMTKSDEVWNENYEAAQNNDIKNWKISRDELKNVRDNLEFSMFKQERELYGRRLNALEAYAEASLAVKSYVPPKKEVQQGKSRRPTTAPQKTQLPRFQRGTGSRPKPNETAPQQRDHKKHHPAGAKHSSTRIPKKNGRGPSYPIPTASNTPPKTNIRVEHKKVPDLIDDIHKTASSMSKTENCQKIVDTFFADIQSKYKKIMKCRSIMNQSPAKRKHFIMREFRRFLDQEIK